MTERILVLADPRLEHLLTDSSEGPMQWEGWTVGGATVRALATRDDAAFLLGGDANAERLSALLNPAARRYRGKGRTAQRFRVSGPSIRLGSGPSATSRCPFCNRVHGVDRHHRPPATRSQADLVVTDSLRDGAISARQTNQLAPETLVVLEDPATLRFFSTAELVARLNVVSAAIMTTQVAASLARRLGVERQEVHSALRVPLRVVGDELGDVSIAGQPAGGRPSPLEEIIRDEVVRRLGDRRVGSTAVPTERFDGPIPLTALVVREDRCPLCGLRLAEPTVARTPDRRRAGISHNLGWLRRRALNAADKPSALAAARQLLDWRGTAYVVASGGSAIAGNYISQVLRERSELFATDAFPSDYVKTGVRTDALVLVSYSGHTPDHVPVIRRARALGVERIALICRTHQPRLQDELGPGGLVVAYGNSRNTDKAERGFVSLAATVAPCALMLAAAAGPASLEPLATGGLAASVETGRRLGALLRDSYELHVLGSGYCRPAMLDLESKWVEGDLGPVTVHQSKDFSHGRFMSLLAAERRAAPLMLSVGDDPYEAELLSTLLDEHRASEDLVALPCRLQTQQKGLLGALELLIAVQEVAAWAGHEIGKDLSRPERIDPGGLRLYWWSNSAPRASGELWTRTDAPDKG